MMRFDRVVQKPCVLSSFWHFRHSVLVSEGLEEAMSKAGLRSVPRAKKIIKHKVFEHTYTLNSHHYSKLRGAESVCMFHFDDKTQGFRTYIHSQELSKG